MVKKIIITTFIFLGRQPNRSPNIPLITPSTVRLLRENVQVTGELAFLSLHTHPDVSRVIIVQIVTAGVKKRRKPMHRTHVDAQEVQSTLRYGSRAAAAQNERFLRFEGW